MATKQNIFIRKFNDLAIIMTVTSWDDYKELMNSATDGHENPDFLLSGVTTSSIYSNFQPAMQINTYEAIDITEGTAGAGLASIFTEGIDGTKLPKKLQFLDGPFWAYKKCGLTSSEEMSTPRLPAQ